MVVKLKRMWARHLTHRGEKRNVYRILDGKPKLEIQLGIIMHRRENNIKICLLKNLRLWVVVYYYFGIVFRVLISVWRPAIPTEYVRDFLQSLQENARAVL
jgi:hypothetical protein